MKFYFGIVLGGEVEAKDEEEAKALLLDMVKASKYVTNLDAEYYHIDKENEDGEDVRIFDECNGDTLFSEE